MTHIKNKVVVLLWPRNIILSQTYHPLQLIHNLKDFTWLIKYASKFFSLFDVDLSCTEK